MAVDHTDSGTDINIYTDTGTNTETDNNTDSVTKLFGTRKI